MKNTSTKPLIIAGIVLLFVFVVGLALRSVSEKAARTTTVTIKVAPKDSNIQLNGKNYENGVHKIKPGEYDLVITREGFTSINTKVTLTGDNADVGYALVSSDKSTADWYEKNQEDAAIAESIHGDIYDRDTAAQREETPILNELPFVAPGLEFRIDYGPDDSDTNKVVIYISANTEDAKKSALQWIKDQGTDPNTLKIVYEKFDAAPLDPNSPVTQSELEARQ